MSTSDLEVNQLGKELRFDTSHATDREDEIKAVSHSSSRSISPATSSELDHSAPATPSDGSSEDSIAKVKDVEAQTKGQAAGQPAFELQDQTNLLPPRQVLVVFAGLSLALFCASLNQTIIVTALPTLGQALGRADIVSWVGMSYLLTSTVMQPLYGRLSDIFGRKPALLASCAVFFLGSLACSLSTTMIQLICFRAVQGIGGGGIMTLSMIIISDIVTMKERGTYLGIIGMVIAISNSIGPLIGGLLTEKANWRWLFRISLCLTPIAFLVILFILPLKTVSGDMRSKLRAVDWLGSILTLTWAALFLIGLSWAGTQYAWNSPAVIIPIIIAATLFVLFLVVERQVSLPIIPLYIFRSSTVSASMAATFFLGAAFFSLMYYLPTYLQVVHEVSPIRSGLLTLPLAITQTVMSFFAGFVASKTGDYWWTLVSGFAIWTLGLGLMSTITATTSEPTFIAFEIVVAVGAGQTIQTSLLAIQAAVSRKDMASATGTRNFMRLLGGTVGLAACSAVVNNIAGSWMHTAGVGEQAVVMVLQDPTLAGDWIGMVDPVTVRDAYAHGIQGIFYLLTPLTAISCLIILFFVEKIPLRREDDEARKEEGRQWVEERRNKRRGSEKCPSAVAEEGQVPPVVELWATDTRLGQASSREREVGDGGGEEAKQVDVDRGKSIEATEAVDIERRGDVKESVA